MDNNVLDYLYEGEVKRKVVDDNNNVIYYEPNISKLCSCTLINQVPWGIMAVTIGEEQHYDEL